MNQEICRTTYCSGCSDQTFVAEVYGVTIAPGAHEPLRGEDIDVVWALGCERCGKQFTECSVCHRICDPSIRGRPGGEPVHADCRL